MPNKPDMSSANPQRRTNQSGTPTCLLLPRRVVVHTRAIALAIIDESVMA